MAATLPEPGRGAPGRALAWLAVAALLAIAWLSHLFATGLLLGALAGFTLQPMYDRLARWSRRPLLASVTLVLATGTVILGAVVAFVSSFVTQALALIAAAREGLKPGGALSGWLEAVTGWLGRFGISTESLRERLEGAATEIASGSAGAAGAAASLTFRTMLGLFFALLTMHVVIRHWPRMAATAEGVSPLRPEYTRALLEEFRRVGRLTLSGTIVTGLAQGTLAGLGYWITGVPIPLFLAVATAMASLVPAVGTLLVWVPAGIYLFAVGHPTMGVVELLWGTLVVVGFSDYVIRPRLVGDAEMPILLTFLALFGGFEVMGLMGLIAGPVIMALAVAVLRLYAREAGVRAKKPRG